MRSIAGSPAPHDWIGFEAVDILDEFDFPRIFTCRDNTRKLYLAYNCGYDRDGFRFLVVPCDDSLVIRLANGKINLRDALTKNQAWIFDLNNEWEPIGALSVDVDKLPFDMLPRPGTMLYSWQNSITVPNNPRPCTSDIAKKIEWPKFDNQRTGILVNG